MNPALLAVLINEVAVPELTRWLRGLHDQGKTITDVEILQKLVTDSDVVAKIGKDWLAAHPAP